MNDTKRKNTPQNLLIKRNFYIKMADVIENHDGMVKSQEKLHAVDNTARTLGVIGTALSGLGMLGIGMFGGNGRIGRNGWNNGYDYNNGRYNGLSRSTNEYDHNVNEYERTSIHHNDFHYNDFNNFNRFGMTYGGMMNWNNGIYGVYGGSDVASEARTMTSEDLYMERKECKDYLDITKQYYEGKLENKEALTNAFFDAYKRDIDNSFQLYKYTRDSNDAIMGKIADVEKKVDIMAAVRPYQDALIDNKINTNAILANYALDKRTCRMVEGQLVLPSTPEVTGYGSFATCRCNG